MSICVRPLEGAKDEIIQRRNDLWTGYSRPADFYSISIHIDGLIGAADNYRHWTGGRLIRVPIELTSRDRLTLLTTLGKEQTGVHGWRRCRVCVSDDNSRAFHGDSE